MSLLELLVAITIIGILMAITLPAVQSARATARSAMCSNNLHQLGVAMHSHEATYGRFPSNGWGFQWIGDPDRGTDRRQPGGWIYNILSYVDQSPLHERGRGAAAPARRIILGEVMQTPLELFSCPSRPGRAVTPANPMVVPYNADWQPNVAKTDYAVNEGDWISDTGPGPPTLEEGDRPDYPWRDMSPATGICFQRSEIRTADVRDGLSQTYLIGEKYVDYNSYDSDQDSGFDQSMYSGVDLDLNRWTIEPPLWDADGPAVRRFGSVHPGGCHFLFCDGSVRRVSYSIDAEVHRQAGNRRDVDAR